MKLLHKDLSYQLQGQLQKLLPVFVGISLLFVGIRGLPVKAAEFYFGAPGTEVELDKTFEIGVFLNTQSTEVNAFEGAVVIPEDRFVVRDVRFEGSVAAFWISRPSPSARISFVGALPGGYAGTNARLFSIILEASGTGEATVRTEGERVLLDDGMGTAASVTRAPLRMTVLDVDTPPSPQEQGDDTTPQIIDEWQPPPDTDPPEPFTPGVAQNESLFDGRWFVVFLAHDKGSGIDHYEIIESRNVLDPNSPDLPWTVRESPTVLQDQELKSHLYVKAVDRAGNTRISYLPPQYTSPAYTRIAILGILFLAIIGAVWGRYRALTKHRNSPTPPHDDFGNADS